MSKQEEKQLIAFVFNERCKAVATAGYCQKRLDCLRRVSTQTVRNYLHKAGLAWLRRRGKSWVPSEIKTARAKQCEWILSHRQPSLDRWAYVDGTTFYLARGPLEHEGKQRVALGHAMYRMANGKDVLWGGRGSGLRGEGG